MATMDSEGRIKSTFINSLKTLHGHQRLAERFNSAGVPSAFEPEMALWLRCEAPLLVAIQSIALAGQRRRGGGATWAEAKAVARGLHGGFAIVKGPGVSPLPVCQVHDVLFSQLPDRLPAFGFFPHPRNA
jgi:2-dehydropantoate 2-reductase